VTLFFTAGFGWKIEGCNKVLRKGQSIMNTLILYCIKLDQLCVCVCVCVTYASL